MTDLLCRCGQCRLSVAGPPIMAVECLCASCAAAARRLAARGAAPELTGQGGTAYVMYRKDRVAFPAGRAHLAAFRLTADATTRRVIASCCGTPMFLEFMAGHWVSIYAQVWPQVDRPRAELRTMARDHPNAAALPPDLPNLARHNLRFMRRLLWAWVAMGCRAPHIDAVQKELKHA